MRILQTGKNEKAHGFTFFEVLIAISIIGIMLLISSPAIQRNYEHIQAMVLGRRVVTLLNEAKRSAIKSGMAYSVYFEESGGYRIVSEAGETSGKLPDTRITPATKVTFYPNGTSDGGSILINSRENKPYYEISIQQVTGRIRLEDAR